jgi:sec-independent protein translocase protein TatA
MHLIIILFIVLIIFGPGRLPELGEGLGKSIRGFKKALSGGDDQKIDATSIEKIDEKRSQ